MPQVVESKSLSRPENYTRFDCRWPQMIGHEHIAHARSPSVRFRGRKHPVSGVTIGRRLLPLSEHLSKLSSHWDGRPGLLGLQFLGYSSVDPRSTHVNAIIGVIDVLPLKSGNFGKPQARNRDQESHGAFRL